MYSSPRPRLIQHPRPKLTFGQYRGQFIDTVPPEYLKWALDNYGDMWPWLREAIEEHLASLDEGDGTPRPGERRPRGPSSTKSRVGAGEGVGLSSPLGDRTRGANPCADFLANVRNGSHGQWVALPASWCRTFGMRAAGVLAHLLNAAQIKADDRGWMKCEPQFLEDRLGLSEEAQDKVLAQLEEDGVVKVKDRNGSRVIRIDTTRIDELVAEEVQS